MNRELTDKIFNLCIGVVKHPEDIKYSGIFKLLLLGLSLAMIGFALRHAFDGATFTFLKAEF